MTCLIPIANGTEEMEAVIIADMLRRAGVEVTIAGDGDMITCSRGIRIVPDVALYDLADDDEFDLIVLPGGTNGVHAFIQNQVLRHILALHRSHRRPVAALCAAPLVLHEFGLLRAKNKITSHPSVEQDLVDYNYTKERVVEDNGILTSRGAGTAFEFTLEIIRRFVSEGIARNVATDIVLYE